MRQATRFLVPTTLLIGLGSILATLALSGEPRGLLLPTQTPLTLSSSFGEYRSGHYHGGIDFSTGGNEGIPIRAPGEGWVFRLRTSGVGYGRAVYFRLEDGRTVLFAHLSRFHPRLQSLAEQIQDRVGRYEVDHYPPDGEYRFQAGETLGYSGQSGAGPPHLHAEIRTGADASVAINPQDGIWHIPDPVPPRMTRVLVEPADPGTQINGGVDGVVIDLANPSPLTVTGAFRLWVESSDYGPGSRYRMAPKRVLWRIDEQVVSEVSFDRFHWNWAREVEWTFHNPRAREQRERWICLIPAPGTRQTIGKWGPAKNWGRELSPGVHRMILTAMDHAGNQTEVNVSFLLGAPEARIVAPRTAEPDRQDFRSRGTFLDLWVSGAGESPGDLSSISPGGETRSGLWKETPGENGWLYQTLTQKAWAPGLWTFQVDPGPVHHAVWVDGAMTHPGEPTPLEVMVELQEEEVTLSFPPGATYGGQWITVTADPIPAPVPELTPVSRSIRLGPGAAPLRERIRVGIKNHGNSKGLVLCSFDGKGWSYEGADLEHGMVTGTLNRLETVAIFRDTDPPRIVPVPPLYDPDTNTVRVQIQEEGSGVVWRDLTMVLDGQTVIAEWDPDSTRLVGHLRSPLAAGNHEILVVARDRAGNDTRKSLNFLAR